MKHKLLSLLVALIATTALWASNTITYTASAKLTETTSSSLFDSGLHINAFNVSISSHTFSDGTGTITFSGEITMIRNYAFYDCSGLTSVSIPNSVTTIGDGAFGGCSGLTSVTIGNSVTTIGEDAFYLCTGLTSIDVDAANTHYCSVDGVLFNYAKDTLIQYPIGKVKSLYTIPNSVTTIGSSAFSGCSGLTSVTIPNSVTTIGNFAFADCTGLTSITIPNSVTTIEIGAFLGCSGLTSPVYNVNCFAFMPSSYKGAYTIPDGIKQIAGGAFEDCSGLTSVTIPNSVTTIGDDAFYESSGLASVTIGISVTTIGNHAFSGCKGLTSVTIPNSVTEIGYGAFCNCSGLTSVTIPNSVTTIGSSAFSGCSGLTSVSIPNSVTTIGDYAFRDCKGLTSVTIPNSVTTIGDGAFGGCSGLTSVTIGNSVTTIGSYAFSGCDGLTSVTIPNSVTTIGDDAFYESSGLISVTIGNSVTTIGYEVFAYCKGLTSITIPNSVTTIGEYAFVYCDGLTSVTIPNSVTTIGDGAFGGCSGLISVTIGNSVTTIGDYAFYGCSKLTSITIGNSVTTIGGDAFYNCTNLKTVYNGSDLNIKKGSTNYGRVAYYADKVYNGIPKGDFVIKDDTIVTSYIGNATDIIIPDGITTIGDSAFYGCSGLTSVTIPNSVTTIGDDAFEGCSGLTSVIINSNAICSKTYTSSSNIGSIFGSQVQEYIIGDSVNKVGDYAFYNCSTLTSVTIGNSVTTIEYDAFYGCTKLKTIYNNSNLNITKGSTNYGYVAYYADKVYNGIPKGDFVIKDDTIVTSYIGNATDIIIPDGITTIGDEAFRGCFDLTSVTIPNSVTTIGSSAFSGCSGLTSVSIPNSVTTIGNYAFSGCKGLKKTNYTGTIADWCKIKFGNGTANPMFYSHNFFINDIEVKDLVIPQGVDTIGSSAFYNCSGLTSVTIPNSVTKIGDDAFRDCKGLESITCFATNPPACGSSCFYNVDKTIPVYVPARSVDAYKQAYGWKDFKNIQGFPNDYATVTVSATNGTIKGGGKYIKGDTCTLTVTPDYGYYFTQWTDSVTDNPRSFIVTQDTTFEALFELVHSGICGDNLTWNYSDGILVISGTGAMYDYTQGTAPWIFFQDSINSLVINNGCTSIGNFAFYGLSNKNLKTIDIPNSVEQIGQYAFANCEYLKNLYLGLSLEKISANAFANDERLIYITCYAIEPPLLDESAFVNYDAYLSVPCESQADYKVSKGWKLFNKENISCIGAKETPITTDDVTVTPEEDKATLVWPADDQAAGYSIEISKDGVVFCTLKFNAQGQLIGIAFAPSRDGELRTMPAAEMTAKGWQFTVTGLTPGSKYAYTVDVINAQQQSIKQYTGEFTTTGGVPTGINGLTIDNAQGTVRKFIKDNQLYIFRGDKIYNAAGVEL